MSRAARDALRLRARLYRQLSITGVLDPTRAVLVALSGGLDSVCLLHLLHFTTRPPRLVAAHLDHRMRPGSSADAAWVRGLCRAWSIPLLHEVADPPPHTEAGARTMRYAFLERAADEQRADLIVTAHHADDQAETVLFRLLRGTGLTGLAGIPARRGRIVRPLLPFTRAELHAYARACGLTWREDPTNRELRYVRNRIRHEIMPALEAIRPGAARRMAALATRAAQAEAAWNDIVIDAVQHIVTARVESELTLARDRLLAYHPHVRARVVRHLLRELGSHPGRVGTRIALDFIASGASGARIELAGGVTLSREFELLLLGRGRSTPESADVPLEIRSAEVGAGTVVTGGRRYVARWSRRVDAAGESGASEGVPRVERESRGEEPGSRASFDPAVLRFPLELRGWRPGDRIRFGYGRKKLKALFRERGVGRSSRARALVLSDVDGCVLWVVGLARAHMALPGPGDHVFEISVVDDDSP